RIEDDPLARAAPDAAQHLVRHFVELHLDGRGVEEVEQSFRFEPWKVPVETHRDPAELFGVLLEPDVEPRLIRLRPRLEELKPEQRLPRAGRPGHEGAAPAPKTRLDHRV